MMKKKSILIIFGFLIFFHSSLIAEPLESEKYFYIGKMDSYNKNFTLFFKTREKAILARGEEYNYITDYPQDLYIYDNKTKKSSPLISYEWFPSAAKYFLNEYDFPVFPEDFAYYLMRDNKTLIMVSAVKNINQNLKFNILTKKLGKYPAKGKLDFIVSSVSKDCGFSSMEDTYECNYYKPLISQNLIN